MRRREHQSGFSTTVILLAVLVVAVLVVTGVMVYQHHKPSNAKNSAATSSSQPTGQQQGTTTTQPTQATTQYLTITEWGVKAPYSGNDTLTYTLSSDNKIAYIASKQLTTADTQCTSGSAGSIIRYAPNDYTSPYNTGPTVAEMATQNPNLYTHVGNYYYIFAHAQSACGSASITAQNQANDTVKALVPNLQPTTN